MKTKLHCEPNTPPRVRREFRQNAPEGSIAIDGYVTGPVFWEPKRRILNLNHHEGCDRLSTRCTAAQAVLLMRMGLRRAFEGIEAVNVYCNDCDHDVTSTAWVLENNFMSGAVVNPILNRILEIEDMLDTTAGAYGFPVDLPAVEENNWIFESYNRARLNGALARRDEHEFRSIIREGGTRITHAVCGRGERLPLDTKFDILAPYPGWCLVNEVGLNARLGVFGSSIDAFVAVRPHGPDRHAYSIGRRSIFVPFNIGRIIAALNEAEGNAIDRWGGGDTIAGSPRASGSKLAPEEVAKIVNEFK